MKTDPHKQPGTILVTGGSRGIGAAACLLAARAGWAVAVNYARDEAAAAAVVKAIVDAGGQAMAVRADVAIDAEVIAMFEAVDRALPPLAGLVNNAGVVDVGARVDAISAERLQRMFAINVFGSFYCAREAIRRMTTKPAAGAPGAHRGGAIVNLSSAAAKLGGGGQYVDYAAAKGASGGAPDRAAQMAPRVPLQRAGTADEVGEAILWLLSPGSSYTTGSIVEVTGGR